MEDRLYFLASGRALQHVSGKPGDRIEIRPDTAVAYGAALIAANRAGAWAGTASRLKQRIAGFDLGFYKLDPATGAKERRNAVITKNTPIPSSRTRVYYTHRDDQKRIVFEVVQRRNLGDEPTSLGSFVFPITQPHRNHPLEVTLGYDDRGLVTVVARDPDTGRG